MPAKKTPAKTAGAKTRQIKTKPYKSFRLAKRIKHPKSLTGSFQLFGASIRFLRQNWCLFFGIVLIYLLLTVVIVKGLGISTGISEAKDLLSGVVPGGWGSVLTGLTLFGALVSDSTSASSDVAGVYQSTIVIMTSLAVIWALRQTYAKTKTSVRESFYKGMYPAVPFLLVLIVIGLQLIPLVVANWLYAATIAGGLAVTAIEKAAWILLMLLLALLSLYMVSSSIFALYISTLPNMTPMAALRSARNLVRYRRWTVMRKVLFLPIMLLVLGALIMVPLIMLLTGLAEWVYFGLSMLTLVVVHSYMYCLYRELL